MRELSPDFDDDDYDVILEWGEAKVTCDWLKDDFPLWTLSWKPGFISFWGIEPEDEKSARKAAALFIYLWTRGVDAGLAEKCGNAYALHYEEGSIRKLQYKEDIENLPINDKKD